MPVSWPARWTICEAPADARVTCARDWSPDVCRSSRDANQALYSDNYGLGFRLNIPRLGPLRLDYGIPINHDTGISGSGRFQFSVGFTRFDF